MTDNETGEVIPPERVRSVNLATLGDVRSEMGKVYNEMKKGRVDVPDATRRIWALRQIGSVIEAAEKLGIGAASDADERPVFAGLNITPPPSPELRVIDGDKQSEPQRIKK